MTLASAGSGLQAYARTGSVGRATAVTAFSAIADFSAGRAMHGLGKTLLSKMAPEKMKFLSELTAAAAEAAGEMKERCGG